MPNLVTISEDFFRLSNPDEVDAAGNTPAVNLSKVKMSVVGQPVWRTVRPPDTKPESAQKVTVQRHDTRQDAYGTLSTSKEFRCRTEVFIESDVIKGVVSQLNLPLDQAHEPLLGQSLKIDVSKAQSSSSPVVPIDIHTGQQFASGASANVALVHQKVVDYKGEFECTVKLEGKVIFQLQDGIDEYDLAEVLNSLESEKPDMVGDMMVDRANGWVTVRLRGRVSFEADNENIQWQ